MGGGIDGAVRLHHKLRDTTMTQIKTALKKAVEAKEATVIRTEALSPELIKAVAAMVSRQNAEIAAKKQTSEPAKPISTHDSVKVQKKHIDPIEITIKLTASKVSETGTLSGFEIDDIKCAVDIRVFAPRMSPHSLMMQVYTLDGIKIRQVVETGTPTGNKRKLF